VKELYQEIFNFKHFSFKANDGMIGLLLLTSLKDTQNEKFWMFYNYSLREGFYFGRLRYLLKILGSKMGFEYWFNQAFQNLLKNSIDFLRNHFYWFFLNFSSDTNLKMRLFLKVREGWKITNFWTSSRIQFSQ